MNKPEYVFVAWGIGITPFRSMIQSLINTKSEKKITLFYSASNVNEFIFKDIFTKAEEQVGINIFYLKNKELNEALLKQKIIDPLAVTYYLSGPQEIVEQFRETLFQMGVENSQIKTDLFTGYQSE